MPGDSDLTSMSCNKKYESTYFSLSTINQTLFDESFALMLIYFALINIFLQGPLEINFANN